MLSAVSTLFAFTDGTAKELFNPRCACCLAPSFDLPCYSSSMTGRHTIRWAGIKRASKQLFVKWGVVGLYVDSICTPPFNLYHLNYCRCSSALASWRNLWWTSTERASLNFFICFNCDLVSTNGPFCCLKMDSSHLEIILALPRVTFVTDSSCLNACNSGGACWKVNLFVLTEVVGVT